MSGLIKMKLQVVFIICFTASLLINGCGPVGVLGPKPDCPPFISRVDMEKFKSEKATREQVREHFGNPSFRDAKESYYCYLQEQETIRAVLMLIFLVPFPGPDYVFYQQLVGFEFDSEGHVFDVQERWKTHIGVESPPWGETPLSYDELFDAWLKEHGNGELKH